MNKIVIEISGGMVQNIYSDLTEDQIDIVILDMDSDSLEEDEEEELYDTLKGAIATLNQVY